MKLGLKGCLKRINNTIGQWLPNFSIPQNHFDVTVKCRWLGPIPRVSDSEILGFEIFISPKFPGIADAANARTTL